MILRRADEFSLTTNSVCIPRGVVFPHSALAVDRCGLVGLGDTTSPSCGLGTGQGTKSIGEGDTEVALDHVHPGMGIVFQVFSKLLILSGM
jgi:hypothetical protein